MGPATAALMTGVVEWPALIAIVGAIVTVTLGVSGGACLLLWKAWSMLADTRHAVNAEIKMARVAIEDKVDGMEERVELKLGALEARLRKVEAENLLHLDRRQDFIDFRSEVRGEFATLRTERKSDMQGLHIRLNDLIMVPKAGE